MNEDEIASFGTEQKKIHTHTHMFKNQQLT